VAGRAADVVTKPVLSRTAYIISQADDDEIVTDTSEEIVLAIGSPTPKYQSPSPSKHKATPDKAKEKTSDSTTACLLCGKKNHTVENCYGLRRPGNGTWIRTRTTVHLTRHALVGQLTIASKTSVSLDAAASKSIFGNKRLLTNVHETEPITFIGFKGSLTSNLVENFQGIMDCYYSKEASANILSYSELASNRKINITSRNNKFRVRCNGLDHLYEHEDGFYVKSFPEAEEVKEKPDQAVAFLISVASTPPGTTISSVEEAAALAITVREMEDQYPPGDVKQAKIAQEFRRRLGVPAKASIMKLLLHNGSGNVSFSLSTWISLIPFMVRGWQHWQARVSNPEICYLLQHDIHRS
jgi:hypothetical protein